MEVYVKMIRRRNKVTISTVWIDGQFICHSLEPTYRNLPNTCPYTNKGQFCKCESKYYGITAIPEGTYRAKYMFSDKYKRRILRLLDIPHFISVLFYSRNVSNPTDGYIIAGDWDSKHPDTISNSKEKLSKFEKMIRDATDTLPVNSVEIYVTIDRNIDSPFPFQNNINV